MSDSLSFKYTLTEEDFVGSIRYHALRQVSLLSLWVLLAAMVFAMASALFYLIDRPRLNAVEIIPLTIIILIPAYFAYWVWWGHPKRVTREAPYLNVEIEGTASANGVTSRSRLGNHESAWGSYSAALESDGHFLLYVGRNVFSPFPKRAFTDSRDVDRFRDLIRAHVPKFKGGKPGS